MQYHLAVIAFYKICTYLHVFFCHKLKQWISLSAVGIYHKLIKKTDPVTRKSC
jgi:hypothetical protein